MFRGANEIEQVANFRSLRNFFFDAREGLGSIEAGACEDAKGRLQRLDRIGAVAAALEADAVGSIYLDLVIRSSDRIRKHILLDDAVAAHHGVPPDAAVLMDSAQPADIRVVIDDHVSGEGDRVGENRVVVNGYIVRHMNVGHQQIAVSD